MRKHGDLWQQCASWPRMGREWAPLCMGHALELPAVSSEPCSYGGRVPCTAAGCSAPCTTANGPCSQPQFQQISPPRKSMALFEETFCAERAFPLQPDLLDVFIAIQKTHQAGSASLAEKLTSLCLPLVCAHGNWKVLLYRALNMRKKEPFRDCIDYMRTIGSEIWEQSLLSTIPHNFHSVCKFVPGNQRLAMIVSLTVSD